MEVEEQLPHLYLEDQERFAIDKERLGKASFERRVSPLDRTVSLPSPKVYKESC